jgi:DNA-binding response OmpR family regulator
MMSSMSQAKRAGWTILVVDDEPAILDLIQRVLQHAHHNVITSRSGDRAWDFIERGQLKVDLVLTDIVMPGSMDGFSLAGKIRRKYRKLPVLFMTGAVPETDEKAAAMTKRGLLLRKPFSPKALVEFIRFALGGKRSRSHLGRPRTQGRSAQASSSSNPAYSVKINPERKETMG